MLNQAGLLSLPRLTSETQSATSAATNGVVLERGAKSVEMSLETEPLAGTATMYCCGDHCYLMPHHFAGELLFAALLCLHRKDKHKLEISSDRRVAHRLSYRCQRAHAAHVNLVEAT